jgi:hypothetical protein
MRRTCESEGVQIENWREGGDEPELPTSQPNSTNQPKDEDDTSDNPAMVADDNSVSATTDSLMTVCDDSTMSATDNNLTSTIDDILMTLVDDNVMTSETSCDQKSACDQKSPGDAEPQRSRSKALQDFRQAQGQVEFSTDGTSCNTLEGWREIRLALWLKRPLADPAEPYEWDARVLPKPTARAVLVDMAPSDEFAARWRDWLYDLGIEEPTEISVLADGAEWIWKQAAIQYPGSEGVLDIYHASEHIAEAVRAIFGDRQGSVLGWMHAGICAMVRDGWEGICQWIAKIREAAEDQQAAIKATESLVVYLAKHTKHLHYRQRLASGKSIGSGPVEGAAKQLVGRRLKQTGARWQPKNAIAMTTLVSAEYVGDWDLYWSKLPQNQQAPQNIVV